jgi:hypothetical protein
MAEHEKYIGNLICVSSREINNNSEFNSTGHSFIELLKVVLYGTQGHLASLILSPVLIYW